MIGRRAPARLDEHDPTDRCALIHCYAHDIDEPGHGYLTCPECGHLYRTPSELRRAYLRESWRTLRYEWSTDPRVGPLTRWAVRRDALICAVGGLFRPAGRISFCQYCLVDF
ncbi:MAG TPA: hypothetical protein VFR67_06135 [Pilimelia sp.]|nr:hypothetical protein [Pilimelia sp.]